MRQIRMGTFETNSSSTHSMVIAAKDTFEKWQCGEVYVDDDRNFVTKEDALLKYEKERDSYEFPEKFPKFEDWINTWSSELWEYDFWEDDLEHETTTYTTPGGEIICIECAYGTDY